MDRFGETIASIGIGILAFFVISMVMIMSTALFSNPTIEIQRVKQVDDGYYITINNEVYEYLEG